MSAAAPDDWAVGYFLGVLVGEGHFGGDGKQAHITLRMHTRHERLFRWLVETFPGSRLYGPYHHAGRSYFQWMVRGTYLKDTVVPLINAYLDRLDDHVAARFLAMCRDYDLLPAATAT